MPARRGLIAPQNNFLDTIATRFDGTHSNFVLGNAKIASTYPIVYCSDGFCELTGQARAHIMQKSCACNFLYGAKTDVQHRDAISRALNSKQELKLEVILYKSSGTPFWCLLDIVPIQDEKHEVVLFLCSHKDITKQKIHEQHQKQHQQQLLHNKQQLLLADQQQQQREQHASASELHELAQQRNQNGPAAAPNSNANSKGDSSDILHRRHSADLHRPTNEPRTSLTSAQDQHQQAATTSRDNLPEQSQQQQHDFQQLRRPSNESRTSGLDQHQQLLRLQEATDETLIDMDEFGITDQDLNQTDEMEGFEHGDGSESDDQDKHTTNLYSRRRSRAVLYQLSGHYGQRRSVNMKSKLKLNNRMNIPEYKTTTIEKQRFILFHYGLIKTVWDWIILIVTFYVAIVVPYNATFKPYQQQQQSNYRANSSNPFANNDNDLTLLKDNSQLLGDSNSDADECKIETTDLIVEGIFLIDVFLNLRTTYVNRKGEVVTKPRFIMRHYFRTWFVVDVFAALPIDFLCGRFQSRVDLNLVKLIRLLRLARLLQKMDRYSQYSYIILTMLMLIFSLLAHWCACIWYVIAISEIEHNPPDWKIGWLHQLSDKLGYKVLNATDMTSSYITALYFTTSSLTSVGFGNVSANTNMEKIFSIAIMLIGALMHAVVFGNVTALIRVMYARRSNYQTRLRDLKDFFRLHQVPKELQQRMNDYFQTTWSLNHGIETYEILKDFPEELRGDVSLHLHREVLSLPIFETAPQGFLKSLARHIESKFCCPTEYLIHRGDALNYLYLVCNGSMEVLQDNMVVAILGKGDLVGYDVGSASLDAPQFGVQKQLSASNMLVKSSSDLKALTYCDLKCIHILGLLEVLKLYPEFSDTFHEEIIHDLSFNLRETSHEEGGLMGGMPVQLSEITPGHEDDDDDDDEDVDDEEQDDDEDDDDEDDQDDDDEDEGGQLDHGHHRQVQEDDDDEDEDDDGDDDRGLQGRGCQSLLSTPRPGTPPPHFDHLYNSMAGERHAKQQRSKTNGHFGGANLARSTRVASADQDDEDQDCQVDEETDEAEEDGDDVNASSSSVRRRSTDDDDQNQPPPPGAVAGAPEQPTKASQPLQQQSTESTNDQAGSSSISEPGPRSHMTSRLRVGGLNPSARPPSSKKPPICFDLSRNTTAIVDRRRRSAGCIVKPPAALLQQAAASQARAAKLKPGHASSLLHITTTASNNNSLQSSPRAPPSSRRNLAENSKSRSVEQQQLNNRVSSGCKVAPTKRFQASDTSQSLETTSSQQNNNKSRSLEEQMLGISMSLDEIRREIGQFHGKLASLQVLLANTQQRQQPSANQNNAPLQRQSSSKRQGQKLSMDQIKSTAANAADIYHCNDQATKNKRQQQQQHAPALVSWSQAGGQQLDGELQALSRSQSSGSLLINRPASMANQQAERIRRARQQRRPPVRWLSSSIPDETDELRHELHHQAITSDPNLMTTAIDLARQITPAASSSMNEAPEQTTCKDEMLLRQRRRAAKSGIRRTQTVQDEPDDNCYRLDSELLRTQQTTSIHNTMSSCDSTASTTTAFSSQPIDSRSLTSADSSSLACPLTGANPAGSPALVADRRSRAALASSPGPGLATSQAPASADNCSDSGRSSSSVTSTSQLQQQQQQQQSRFASTSTNNNNPRVQQQQQTANVVLVSAASLGARSQFRSELSSGQQIGGDPSAASAPPSDGWQL